MARPSLGSWIRKTLGGADTDSGNGGLKVGSNVITNSGTILGTIEAVWKGTGATDGAKHEDTVEVRRTEQSDGSLFIPADAIAKHSDKGVVLAVDTEQVIARGWRFRPVWLPQDTTGKA